jgi:hypothetical protein
MPIKKCVLKGKPGWKWGDAGICYTGDDAKEKAVNQGMAALTAEAKRSGLTGMEEIRSYIEKRSKEEI